MLATDAVVEHLWRTWGNDKPCPEDFYFLVRMLVNYHVGMARLKPLFENHSKGDFVELFEEAFSSVGGVYKLILSADLRQQWRDQESKFGEMLEMMGDGLFYELGAYFGRCRVELDDNLTEQEIRVQINDVRSYNQFTFGSDQCLVNDTVDRLTSLNIEGREAVNPANGSECAIISNEDADIAEQDELTTWDQFGYIILMMSSYLRRNASSLLSLDIVRLNLDLLRQAFPALTDRVSAKRLANVLRSLQAEEISIRNLRFILETLLNPMTHNRSDDSKYIVFRGDSHRRPSTGDPGFFDTDSVALAEAVRSASKRYISHKYTRGGNTLVVYLLDPEIEKRLRKRAPLLAEERDGFIAAIASEVGNLPPDAQNPVLLTTDDLRFRLRQEIKLEFPHLAVLSYQELAPDMNIQPIARISADDWPLSRGELWRRRYALRVGESYSLLLKAFAAKTGSGGAISDQPLDSPSWEDFAEAEYLQDCRADIVKRISNRIGKEHPSVSSAALQDFVERYLEAYLSLLFSGRADVLTELLSGLSPALAKAGTKCSDVYGMSLMISTVTRELLAEKDVDQDDKEAMARFNQSLEQTEAAAHRAARMALDTCFQFKLERLIQ
jgi:hypothetical protein